MFNQFRTLLLNETADPTAGAEELLDPRFVLRPLGPTQSLVRDETFRGAEGSRTFRNFIATTLTRLTLGCPDLAPVVAGHLDPRVYLYPATLAVPGAVVTCAQGLPAGASVTVGGSFPGDPANGVFAATWLLGPESIAATPVGTPELDVDFPEGEADASLPIFLPDGGGLFVQFFGLSALPAGFEVRVDAAVGPTFDVLGLLARLRARAEVGVAFANPAIDGSPDAGATLRELYDAPDRPDVSLGALLLAHVLGLGRPF